MGLGLGYRGLLELSVITAIEVYIGLGLVLWFSNLDHECEILLNAKHHTSHK